MAHHRSRWLALRKRAEARSRRLQYWEAETGYRLLVRAALKVATSSLGTEIHPQEALMPPLMKQVLVCGCGPVDPVGLAQLLDPRCHGWG